jgi:DNA repair exonuclease SbcCD ATPase subunit
MSDANKFVNTYIDFAVNQLHENLNLILQLKTQLKLAGDSVTEKDEIISKLTADLETNKADNQEIVKVRDQARKWEDAHNAVANKVSHLETALNQINQMKKDILTRDETIARLESELEQLKNPPAKKAINTKAKKSIDKEPVESSLPLEQEISSIIEKPQTDDF